MMENKTKIDLKNTSIFITGAAGFIGSNLAKRILTTVEGAKVVGLDNMNHYYDVRLKEARLDELNKFENFSFVKGNLADKETITTIFEQYKPQIVVNLGAQAGVRYSITNPDAYVEANLIGFYNILEACRHSYDEGHTPVEHLVYASSSSVYGSNKKVPYSTDDKVDNPVSLYEGCFRKLFFLAFVTSLILFRTLLNRKMWMNPLSDVMGGWGIWETVNGERQLTTECIENVIMMVPFSAVVLWTFGEKIENSLKKILWQSGKIAFCFSISIEIFWRTH